MANLEELKKQLNELSIVEVSQLVKELEKDWGVSAQAVTTISAPAPTVVAQVKDTFDVVLTSFGTNKIECIKKVREVTKLGLVEAKNLVEGLPKTLKEGVSKDEAESTKKMLTDIGATVELK